MITKSVLVGSALLLCTACVEEKPPRVTREICEGKLTQTRASEVTMFCNDGTVIEYYSYKNYPLRERRSVTSAK